MKSLSLLYDFLIGRVWPHDNALIGFGMARFGMASEVVRVFTRLFDAAMYFDLHRIPELFCGFARDEGRGPILPPFPGRTRIGNLGVGDASVDLLVVRHEHDVTVNVLRRKGDIDVVVLM